MLGYTYIRICNSTVFSEGIFECLPFNFLKASGSRKQWSWSTTKGRKQRTLNHFYLNEIIFAIWSSEQLENYNYNRNKAKYVSISEIQLLGFLMSNYGSATMFFTPNSANKFIWMCEISQIRSKLAKRCFSVLYLFIVTLRSQMIKSLLKSG